MNRFSLRRIVALLALCGFAITGREAGAQPQAKAPGSELTVYLMTMGPGDQVWERFGHNAIWISDRERGIDLAYNWGIFDFGEADFIPRLARGDMLYWMEAFDMQSMLASYTRSNRSVWAQELNLTPPQRLRIRELAEQNARPENREYTYDYYRDNCSTRPRDLIDGIIGGAIQRATATRMTNASFRSHTARLLAGDAPSYSGAMLALGHPADRRISRHEEMFLPMKLREYIRDVTVTNAGRIEPLVLSERQIFAATRAPERSEPPRYLTRYLAAGLAIAGILLGLGVAGGRRVPAARKLFLAVAGAWTLLSGLAGLGLVLAWTATNHVFMYRNENLLQFNPITLAVFALLTAFTLANRGVKALRIAVLAAATLSVLGFLLQTLPGFDQQNGEIVALALPVHLALAWTVVKLTSAVRA